MALNFNLDWETIKSWIKQYPFIVGAILAYFFTQNMMLAAIFVILHFLLS